VIALNILEFINNRVILPQQLLLLLYITLRNVFKFKLVNDLCTYNVLNDIQFHEYDAHTKE